MVLILFSDEKSHLVSIKKTLKIKPSFLETKFSFQETVFRFMKQHFCFSLNF